MNIEFRFLSVSISAPSAVLIINISAFIAVSISVCMLVSAFVCDVLSDVHAVETHVSKGNSVSIVCDLTVGVQVIDQEFPGINNVHFRGKDGSLWSDACFSSVTIENTVYDEFIVLNSKIWVDEV